MATPKLEKSPRETTDATPPRRPVQNREKAAGNLPPSIKEPDYVPPDFGKSRRARIGSSVIEQFVAGHDASDILRELIQNEYDGGGETLTLTFGSRALEVAGTGRNIDRHGWERLSVIVGTGKVMGSREVVAPKENGIGSKNFGLRSLFRFGDEIHVRSGGWVALLDLQTQETGQTRDPASLRAKGVRVHVPYRQEATATLEAFTVEREQHALDLMAAGMPDTLVKLALSGQKRGLREVNIYSTRTGRALHWKQDAKSERCRARNVTMVVRSGRLKDVNDNRLYQEAEFSRSIEIPIEFAGRHFPAYYRHPGDKLNIAVSLPLVRRRIDLGHHGHFYYPLKAPASLTGCAVSVSAPFELNTDRSAITDHAWNDWLIDRAVDLTIDLLTADWFSRYGADAYKALAGNGTANPEHFFSKIAERLAEEECWATKTKGKFACAHDIVIPEVDEFSEILGAERYLDSALASDRTLGDLVVNCGAKRFTISSLIRLRCADKKGESALQTVIDDDANFHYTEYRDSLTRIEIQKRHAAALAAYPRRLSKQHRTDLGNTKSTLSAAGELMPAARLVLVSSDLWADCPESEANRLHPELASCQAIASHCRKFDEDKWLIEAAKRASGAASDDRERQTLYKRILTGDAPISRLALSAIRNNPVIKNQRGEWAIPVNMVHLTKPLARLLDPAIDAPSGEVLKAPGLMARLQIRSKLNGKDLVRYARSLDERPEMAERFEKLLADNLKLLGTEAVEQLRAIPFLKSRSGRLAAPVSLHFDTTANRICLDNDDRIVGGANDALYRKLRLKVLPDSPTILDLIARRRAECRAPNRPDLLYPMLVQAIVRERRPKIEIAMIPICWVGNGYHAPADILVGPRTPKPLAEVIPHYTTSDDIGRAYQNLGAPPQAKDEHWKRFFLHVGTAWIKDLPLDTSRQRLLREVYNARKGVDLPQDLWEVRCLMDDRGRLFTVVEMYQGKLVEPDFKELEVALRNANSAIGFIERSDQARAFFAGLSISALSSRAGASKPVFGPVGRQPFWFTNKQSETVLAMLHRPLFAHALYEIAFRNRHGHPGFQFLTLKKIEARLASLREISFYQKLQRRYSVGDTNVLVHASVAVGEERIAVTTPKTKYTFQLLLAEALAEIAGASKVATMRSIANAFLPLVLCGNQSELVDYLDRMGIPHGSVVEDKEDDEIEHEDGDDHDDDAGGFAMRQVFGKLGKGGATNREAVGPVEPTPPAPARPPAPPPATPSLDLPNLDDVTLTVASNNGTKIQTGRSSGGRRSSGAWRPPTLAENERDSLMGRRGEELVYRMELQKVREMGFPEPEQYVIWTSRDDPGADHDIRSIDANRNPRWLEVKSTTGVDGRFEWSSKEFEKALRDRERYELWRVYRVAEKAPVAKCFPDPAGMLGERQISLELGMLRASIEKLD